MNLEQGQFDGTVDDEGELVAVPFGDRIETVVEAMTDRVDWLILDRTDFAGISSDDFGRVRTELIGRGWQIVNSSPGDDVEVYTFTGIIAALQTRDTEVDFALLDEQDADE